MSVVYFTDRDLGLKFGEILRNAGLTVERFRDHFDRDNCPDEEWLQSVGQRGWVALTHDTRIRYKPNELAAVKRNNVRLLVVIGAAPYPDLAVSFVRTHHRVEAFLKREQAPFIAKVYRAAPADLAKNPEAPGRVERWWPGTT